MIKNNREYRLEDSLVDDELDFYCEGNCINKIGCDFLREIDTSGSHFYCMECARKMFTYEEFKTLEEEALDRYLRHLDELQRDNVRHDYGVCL